MSEKLLDRMKAWVPLGAVPELEPEALQAALESVHPPVLLDVRTRVEWRTSRINGALSVPILEFSERIEGLELSPDRVVVAICLSAHRSIPAVRLLRERGFERAVQLRGGMLAWWARRLPTCAGELVDERMR